MHRYLIVLVTATALAACAGTPTPPPETPAAPEARALPPAPVAEAPPPAAAEQPSRLTANLPAGWEMTQFGGGAFGVVHPASGAQIVFAVLPASQLTPRQAVEQLREQVAQDPGATSEEIQVTSEGGVVTWRYTRTHPDAGVIQGTVMARPSNVDGYAVMAMAMWPAASDDDILPQFAAIAASLSLE